MKHVCLFLCVVLMFSTVKAQYESDRIGNVEKFDRNRNLISEGSGQVGDWYNYGLELRDYLGSTEVTYFRVVMFPDSTVLTNYENGIGAVSKHSLGQTFDPVSPIFEVGNKHIALTDQISYSLDSIAIPYRYFRYQDDYDDTLIIQVFSNSQMVFNKFATPERPYSYVAYDFFTRKGKNPLKEYTYLLSKKDTSMTSQGIISIPVDNMIIKAGEKFAVTVTYFPGNPHSVGDTVSPYITPEPINRVNAFILYEFRDNSKFIDAGIYNNELTANTSVRYNTNQNNWNGKYISGTAWESGYFNMDIDFHITTLNLGITNGGDKQVPISISVFPNPVNRNDYSVLEFNNTIENERIRFDILDVMGRVVKSISSKQYSYGLNKIDLNFKDLIPNIYFINATTESGEGNTITKIVVE